VLDNRAVPEVRAALMRQAVYLGLRDDERAEEATLHEITT
jgi:hypothetical protein